jgi:hypothetical protein
MESSCGYTKASHYTPAAQKYHLDKCVNGKIMKMNDHKKCTSYFAGICHVNNLGGCNLKDIDTMCTNLKTEFTVGDAQELCKAELAGSSAFWEKKYGSKSMESSTFKSLDSLAL